jgi:hypothetical protein
MAATEIATQLIGAEEFTRAQTPKRRNVPFCGQAARCQRAVSSPSPPRSGRGVVFFKTRFYATLREFIRIYAVRVLQFLWTTLPSLRSQAALPKRVFSIKRLQITTGGRARGQASPENAGSYHRISNSTCNSGALAPAMSKSAGSTPFPERASQGFPAPPAMAIRHAPTLIHRRRFVKQD